MDLKTLIVAICLIPAVFSSVIPEAKMPSSCLDRDYCFIKPDDYPQHRINSLVNKTLYTFTEGGDLIKHRVGHEKAVSDCESQPRLSPIYQIRDLENNVRYVVQSEGIFVQKLRTETCRSPGVLKQSNYLTDSMLTTYDVRCEETKLGYSFIALSLDGESLEDVEVKGGLPVCCSCRIYNKSTSPYLN